MAKKTIKVGVIGVRRGGSFARSAGLVGMELVAICDKWEEKLETVGKELNVTTYTDYDKFLEHDMDAVILANYFSEHAPFAIKALKAGRNVMSETSACFTVAEGVELIETVEKTGKIYMFAENYPYMIFNQEMRKIYQSGKVGTFMYGEGEYVHPMSADQQMGISCGLYHWRNWLPSTYYCTHAMAPIMFITDTMPVQVNGFVIPRPQDDPVYQRTVRINDAASVIMVKMDNGAYAKLLQVTLRGHSVWVRINSSRGQMENLRWGDKDMVKLIREQYHEKKTTPVEQIYKPEFPAYAQAAASAGHGGGDFFMNYHFAEAIRKNQPPYWNVYRGVACSIVGIQAYRSALADSSSIEIPDLTKSAVRKKYKNDNWRPDPKKGNPWPSILGKRKPTKQGLEYSKKIWKKAGYEGE